MLSKLCCSPWHIGVIYNFVFIYLVCGVFVFVVLANIRFIEPENLLFPNKGGVSECLRKSVLVFRRLSVLVFRRLSRRDDHYTWAWNSLGRYSSRPALFDRRC